MYLKSLEIQGFKSFGEKVQFQFTPGVSAIVGPNGSGKSNVVDSIRWVLGEQSAKSLRGSKMDDIIFSGSSKRRAVGMAQVSLTLDNADGKFPLGQSEITITRRLYRSGESEYMINKTPCRLKDIHELFLDTGVGREGFSVIGQGKVDEILSLKAEDRRGLIEEAAGIMKYKYRKKEAERRLEETTGNMERLNDIVYELSERLTPLSEQAKKAKSYHIWKKELDSLALSLDIDEMTVALEKKGTLNHKLEQESDAYLAAQTDVNTIDGANIVRKQNLAAKDEELNIASETNYALQNNLEKTINDERMLKQKQEQINLRLTQIAQENAYLKEQQEILAQSLIAKDEESQKIAAQLKKDILELKNYENAEKTAQESLKAQRAAEESGSNDFLNLLQEQAKQNNRKTALEQSVRQQEQLISRSAEKYARLAKSEAEIIAQSSEKTNERVALEEKSRALNEKLRELQQKAAEMQDIYTKSLAHEKNIAGIFQQKNSRLAALSELEESGDGYQYGVKNVLEAKRSGKLTGIIGTAAQVMKVAQKLEKAIEVAMGGSLQNIITTTDQEAQDAINFLKVQKKGRATFMPLNTVKGTKSKENLTEKGVLGLACDLVEYDEKYKDVFYNLLGRVWIVDTLANAVAIGKKHNFSLRMVTLEGEIITPGGAMTGGSTSSQKGGILLRLRQIEELKEESAKLKLDLTAAEQKNKTLAADLESLRQNQVAMTAQKEQYAKDELLAVNALAQLKKEQERLKADISLEKFEQAEAQNILSQSKTEIAAIEIELDLLVKRLAQRQTQENSRKEEIERLEKELAACQQKRHDQEISTIQLKERLQAISEQKSASEQQLASYETQINEKIAEKEEKEQLIAQTSADLAINAEKSAQLKQEFFSSKQKIEILRASREDLRLIIEKNEEILREKQKLVQNWQEKKFQTELELNKYKNRLEVLERNLVQNYECTYEEGLLSKIEITDEAQARKDAAKLKSKINALGNINFAAIEEYDEVKNRLEFLEGQLADLTEAKASLDKVIKDMEQIMAKKFRETYVVVNQIFSEVFATMFGGGEARLQLSNPNDYLKTGVEIMVRPPGKKEQNLSLLSGGERAMTAIALLFALLNVRPSPFCVLDEIEAALDEVNVERFAKFIKEYTKKSQFIVISHRKGTMEAADVLYGVSMENDGVSKLVSVRLEDYA